MRTVFALWALVIDPININIKCNAVEQVKTQKYLGVMLDPQLNFSVQADFAVSKVNHIGHVVGRMIKVIMKL